MGSDSGIASGCGARSGPRPGPLLPLHPRRLKDEATPTPCPTCGLKARVLQKDTGRCMHCSRTCTTAAAGALSGRHQLAGPAGGKPSESPPNRPARAAAARLSCATATGWCGSLLTVRQPSSHRVRARGCGQVRRHAGLGLCSACWQKHPDRPFITADQPA